MSIEIMAKVIENFDLPPREKYITILYANYANRDGEGIWPSQTTIAKLSGYHRTTINKVTGILSEAKILIPAGKTEHHVLKWKINTNWQGTIEYVEKIIKDYNEQRGVDTGQHVDSYQQGGVDSYQQGGVDSYQQNPSVEPSKEPLNIAPQEKQEGKEEKELDLVDGILDFQKDDVNVDHYPVDVQETIEIIANYWGFRIPGKKESKKGYWIKRAREIKKICGPLGLEVVDKSWEAWETYKRKNEKEPYENVVDIGSIVSWIEASARKIRQGESVVQDEEEYDPTDLLNFN